MVETSSLSWECEAGNGPERSRTEATGYYERTIAAATSTVNRHSHALHTTAVAIMHCTMRHWCRLGRTVGPRPQPWPFIPHEVVMAEPPSIVDRRVVARSRLFRIEAVDLVFSNGRRVEFERLGSAGHVGAVIVVPLRDDGTLLLIREYGAGTERYELGLPKGRVEAGEDLLAAANRELREEIGHAARRLTPLRALSLAPGYFGHHTQVILAEGLDPDPAPGDEPEPLDVVPRPLADLETLVLEDEFSEGRSIAALYLARDHLRRREDTG